MRSPLVIIIFQPLANKSFVSSSLSYSTSALRLCPMLGVYEFWLRERDNESSSLVKKLFFFGENLLPEIPGEEKIIIGRLRPSQLGTHHRYLDAGDKFPLFQGGRVARIVKDISTYAAVIQKNGGLGGSAITSYPLSLLL